MTQCGRCNSPIRFGFFCNSCLSFFSGLDESHLVDSRRSLSRQSGPIRYATPGNKGRDRHEILMVDRGLSIGLRTNDPEALRMFFSCLVPASDLSFADSGDYRYSIEAQPRAHGRRYALSVGDRTLGVVETRAEAVMCLLSHLHWKIAQSSHANIFVHAGVIGWQGAALVMPGRSFTGKTSLVIELLRHGATYFSDEYAIFDSDGMVHPFPRDLHVRSPNGISRRMLPAGAFAAPTATSRLPVGLLLFASYSPDTRWQSRSLTPGHALLGLLQNTVRVRRTPAEVLRSLSRVAHSAPAFAAERGEARRAAQPILRLVKAHTPVNAFSTTPTQVYNMPSLIEELRSFVTDNFLFGQAEGLLADDTSFLENGIVDSTGLLELIGFVERTYNIRLADEELVPDNLDSLQKLATFVSRKCADAANASASSDDGRVGHEAEPVGVTA